ncbi:MAG: hypothetical protein NZ602_14255 [Thermoguttaceae bacterium]|nr:hypothetical protein [Thermoguttaceae bacterium]MDW8039611.1 hypothetical protein [Thermoguttaceae bacterium]
MAKERISVLSSKDGSVWVAGQPVALVLWWALTKRASSKAYVANDTGAWRQRMAGAKETYGQFEMKLQADGTVPVQEGQEVSLRLHVDSTGQNYYELPVLIERISTRVDIATGEVIGCIVDFVSTGEVVGHGMVGQRPDG